jgi:glycosyltransferase involved in cell wall biosynthesis
MQNICAALSGLWFFFRAYRAWSITRSMEFLRDVPVVERRWPKVSLIVPACNEALTIEAAANSILTIDYPELELLVVNDRSQDETGAILERMSHANPRLKTVTIAELPAGWLGKVNALRRGFEAASGEWILFSDADVHFRPQTLKRAITFCENHGVDFLCATPQFKIDGVMLKIAIAQFLNNLLFLYNKKNIKNPRRPDALGAGVFNLVRRPALERSEGFEGIKMEVIDDGGLALLVKKAGGNMDFINGMGEILIEWYPNYFAYLRGLEKNAFSLFQYSAPLTISAIVFSWIYAFVALVEPLLASWPYQVFFLAALASFLICSAILLRRLTGIPGRYALGLPFGFINTTVVFSRSMYHCLTQGGIYWRETFYSLESLRRGQRIRLIDMILGKKL